MVAGKRKNARSAARIRHPAAATEITITRRLYRDGNSEYLIDNKQARLRDIQDLFLGTGLGPESYAIIEQGRIGQILSSKPQDRRSILEEAAGISRYKERRKETESRLADTRENLARVTDIRTELGAQIERMASLGAADIESRLRRVVDG